MYCINQPQNNPNVLLKQIQIAVGYYLITPSGNKYYSSFGTDCVERFVNETLTLQHEANTSFKTNILLEMTSEEEEPFEQSIICWLCENPLGDTQSASGEKVRDNDHLTGKYRGAAHNICNLNCIQMSSSFVPIFFHKFSGYDRHLIFEELLTLTFKIISNNQISIFPKSKENYVSVQVGCLGFLASYRILASGLDKLVKSLDSLPICETSSAVTQSAFGMDENGFKMN